MLDFDGTKLHISTHTLRKEGDSVSFDVIQNHFLISTHTLRKEGDASASAFVRFTRVFQPTPSARRVT